MMRVFWNSGIELERIVWSDAVNFTIEGSLSDSFESNFFLRIP